MKNEDEWLTNPFRSPKNSSVNDPSIELLKNGFPYTL